MIIQDNKGKFKYQGATQRSKECPICKNVFYCKYGLGIGRWEKKIYCSSECNWKSKYNGKKIKCKQCSKDFYITAKASKKYCSKRCADNSNIGKIPVNAWKKGDKPSPGTQFKKGEARITGANNNFWKGGIYPDNLKARRTTEYLRWRKEVKERDNYTCQICGKRGGDMHADHIKPFSLYPELRTELSNGRTLCVTCHKNTETYGRKIQSLKR